MILPMTEKVKLVGHTYYIQWLHPLLSACFFLVSLAHIFLMTYISIYVAHRIPLNPNSYSDKTGVATFD